MQYGSILQNKTKNILFVSLGAMLLSASLIDAAGAGGGAAALGWHTRAWQGLLGAGTRGLGHVGAAGAWGWGRAQVAGGWTWNQANAHPVQALMALVASYPVVNSVGSSVSHGASRAYDGWQRFQCGGQPGVCEKALSASVNKISKAFAEFYSLSPHDGLENIFNSVFDARKALQTCLDTLPGSYDTKEIEEYVRRIDEILKHDTIRAAVYELNPQNPSLLTNLNTSAAFGHVGQGVTSWKGGKTGMSEQVAGAWQWLRNSYNPTAAATQSLKEVGIATMQEIRGAFHVPVLDSYEKREKLFALLNAKILNAPWFASLKTLVTGDRFLAQFYKNASVSKVQASAQNAAETPASPKSNAAEQQQMSQKGSNQVPSVASSDPVTNKSQETQTNSITDVAKKIVDSVMKMMPDQKNMGRNAVVGITGVTLAAVVVRNLKPISAALVRAKTATWRGCTWACTAWIDGVENVLGSAARRVSAAYQYCTRAKARDQHVVQ